jgi:hypothetical protein
MTEYGVERLPTDKQALSVSQWPPRHSDQNFSSNVGCYLSCF